MLKHKLIFCWLGRHDWIEILQKHQTPWGYREFFCGKCGVIKGRIIEHPKPTEKQIALLKECRSALTGELPTPNNLPIAGVSEEEES